MTVSRVPLMWSLREESGDLISQKGFSQTSSSSIRVGKEPQLTKNKDKGDCYLWSTGYMSMIWGTLLHQNLRTPYRLGIISLIAQMKKLRLQEVMSGPRASSNRRYKLGPEPSCASLHLCLLRFIHGAPRTCRSSQPLTHHHYDVKEKLCGALD